MTDEHDRGVQRRQIQRPAAINPSYGQISAGCGPNLREDFADTIWPVVVKVKPAVTKGDLIQHLRDLADVIDRRKPMIEIKLTETNVFTRWPCTICGGCTEKVAILAEGTQQLSDDGCRLNRSMQHKR